MPETVVRPVLHCVLVSLLNGIIYGYTTGVVGGLSRPAVNKFLDVFTVNSTAAAADGSSWACTPSSGHSMSAQTLGTWYGVFTADILVGNLVGAYVGPWFSGRYGRRKAMLLNAVIGAGSSVGMGLVATFGVNAALRTLQGVSIGICATVGPAYTSEVAPPELRGKLGTLFQVAICTAILIAQFTNFMFNPHNIEDCMPDSRWQLQLALAAVPCVLTGLYAMLWMPESPVWLTLQAGSSMAATQSDALLIGGNNGGPSYPTMEAAGVLGTIDENAAYTSQPGSEAGASPGEGATSGWSMLFSRRGCKWLLVAVGLPMCQQLTGINAIMFYGPTIIGHMGFGSQALLVNFLAVGVWNLMSVFVSFALIDRLGRRVLMLGALFLMSCALVVMGVLFHNLPLGSPALSYGSLAMIMIFILAFESGPGPLFFVIVSETFPTAIRAECIASANMLQSAMNIALSMCFPIMIVALGDPKVIKSGAMLNGTGTTFFILGTIAAISFVFVYLRIPETAQTIETDIRQQGRKFTGNADILNERRDVEGKVALKRGLLETPAGVHWSPAVAVK